MNEMAVVEVVVTTSVLTGGITGIISGLVWWALHDTMHQSREEKAKREIDSLYREAEKRVRRETR